MIIQKEDFIKRKNKMIKQFSRRFDNLDKGNKRKILGEFEDSYRLSRIEGLDFIFLKNYLSNPERYCSFTDGNPNFFSGIPIEKTCQCLEKTCFTREKRTWHCSDKIMVLHPNSDLECEGKFFGYGKLVDTSLNSEPYAKQDGIFYKSNQKRGYIDAREYEVFFGLSEGSFKTALIGWVDWRIDGVSDFANYWKVILEENVPFLLETVGKNDEDGVRIPNMGKTGLINKINI